MIRFRDAFRRFAYTDLYLFAFAAIVVIGWTAESAEFGFVALMALTCVALVTLDDILPLTAPIFYAMCMIFTDKVEDFIFMWLTFIPIGIALVIFVVRNRSRVRWGKMMFPQLAVSAALILGGAGVCAAADYVRALPNILFLGIGVLAIYWLIFQFAGRDEKRDVALYFAKMLMWLGFAVLVEVVIWYIRVDLPPEKWGTVARDYGWGIENNAATILSLTGPMCFYLATRYRNGGIYALFGLVQYIGIVLTYSRGGILMAVITGPVCAVCTFLKAVDKKRMGAAYVVIVAALAIFAGVLASEVGDAVKSLFDQGFGPSSRDLLYAEAWRVFTEHPFLGAGLGFNGDYYDINTMQLYWFHSTFFQVIACMGIVGVAAYAFYYIVRFATVFKRIGNPFNLLVLVAWVGFEGYSMIDTGTFVPFPTMALILVMTGILEITNSRPQFTGEADSYNRTFRRGGVAAEARRYGSFTPPYSRAA